MKKYSSDARACCMECFCLHAFEVLKKGSSHDWDFEVDDPTVGARFSSGHDSTGSQKGHYRVDSNDHQGPRGQSVSESESSDTSHCPKDQASAQLQLRSLLDEEDENHQKEGA